MLCLGDVLLGGELGEQDGVAGQAGKAVRFFLDNRQVLPLLFRGQFTLQHEGGEAVDGGDGGLEFMGEVIDEVLLQELDAGQLGTHLVEALVYVGHGVPLVVGDL